MKVKKVFFTYQYCSLGNLSMSLLIVLFIALFLTSAEYCSMVIASFLSLPLLMDVMGVSNFIVILKNVAISFLVKLNSTKPSTVF